MELRMRVENFDPKLKLKKYINGINKMNPLSYLAAIDFFRSKRGKQIKDLIVRYSHIMQYQNESAKTKVKEPDMTRRSTD
jgi:hypothetical protein